VLTWWILRDWVQGALAVLLVPAWIASEWSVRAEHHSGMERYLVEFLMLLALTYLGSLGSAQKSEQESEIRRALVWIGGLAVLPLGGLLAVAGHEWSWMHLSPMSWRMHSVGVLIAYLIPLTTAWILRRKGAIWSAGFAIWAFVVGTLDNAKIFENLEMYALFAAGSIALVFWGLREQRRERINLGVAGFAITIIAFYFSAVMDKLGRSASLVGFGLIFLLGGWKLEQLRRKLVERTKGVAS